MIDSAYFCHLFQRALLFNIPKVVDLISFKIGEKNLIKIFIFSKRKLSEEERDYIFSAISELEGDFTEEITIDLEFVVVETIPIDLAPYGSTVFAFVE